jgi:hypothetical protein
MPVPELVIPGPPFQIPMSANLTYLSRFSKQFRQFLGRFLFAARISGEVGRFATVALGIRCRGNFENSNTASECRHLFHPLRIQDSERSYSTISLATKCPGSAPNAKDRNKSSGEILSVTWFALRSEEAHDGRFVWRAEHVS